MKHNRITNAEDNFRLPVFCQTQSYVCISTELVPFLKYILKEQGAE